MRALVALLSLPALAQTPVAPTGERVGEARGSNAGDYNITQTWELGYRFRDLHGNEGKYRSDVNYSNGLRLLSSRLGIQSRDGHGSLFDELTLSTQGLGNDPYEFASLRAAKNRLYRYDMLWRSSEYSNPALNVAGGLHAFDTVRRLQDHDFTLLPQSGVRFFAGFTRSVQQGPAMTSVNQFELRGDEFPLLAKVDRRQNEFRFGNEVRLFGVRINWMESWEFYSEATPVALAGPSAGVNPNDRTALSSLTRSEPVEGSTPSFRLSLFRERGQRWAVNGRFLYAAGRRDFTFNESATGINRFGAAENRQVLVAGNARRPAASANLTLSLFPSKDLTIINHTAFHSTRMEGDSRYSELNNGSLDLATVDFQYLGIRNITNATDANYQLRPWIAIRGGFQYSDRVVRSVERQTIEDFTSLIPGRQENELRAGAAGVRLRPLKPLTLAADGEIGRQDRPFYPVSDKDYHAFSARAQWRKGPLALSAMARSAANFNGTTLLTHNARSRQYSFDGSWTPQEGFSIEAGYSKLHADTATGIAYFLSGSLTRGVSLYASNIHTGHLGAHFSVRARVDVYAGLSSTRDAGDPRPGFQTYPMNFDAPLGRVSVRLHPKIRWNAGYQFYRYKEEVARIQNYRAHTGYTSVLWTF